jgi:hypothetical protein
MAIPVARYLVEFGKGDSNPPFRAQHELVLPNAFETVEAGLERQVEALPPLSQPRGAPALRACWALETIATR